MDVTKHQFPFLKGGGEMGKLTRAYNWEASPQGSLLQWPVSLRVHVSMMLNSRFPMLIFWGPELITFYNDAFRPSLGNNGKHPSSLGQRGEESWAESWPVIGPMIYNIMAGGEAVWFEDQKLPLYRDGKMGYAYWTYSFGPLTDDEGKINGVLVTCSETTKAVESNKQLGESEARFRSLIQEAPVATCLFTGRELRIEIANDLMLAAWGKDSSITGMLLEDAVPELKGQPFLAILDKVFATGETYSQKSAPASLEVNGEMKSFYFDFIYKPLRDEEGRVYAIMNMVTDVTEQVLARQKVEESEGRLKGLIAAAPAGIGLFVGRDLIIEYPNQTFIDIVGKGPEIEGLPLREAMPELITEGQPFLKILDDVFTTGKMFQSFGSMVKIVQQGVLTHNYYNITYTPVYNAKGEIYAILDIAIDVTEQIKAQRRLEEAEQSMRGAVELAQLGVWSIDAVTGGLTYSARLIEWFGYDPAEQNFTQVIPILSPEDQERVNRAVAWALNPTSDGVYDEIYTVIHPETGKKKVLHAQGKAVFDDDGIPIRMNGTAQDITLQRELQMALEAEVQERTEELAVINEELQATNEELAATNEELEESNTRLVDSNEDLAQYAYVASHDLQEPLRKIRIFSDMLSRHEGLEKQSVGLITKISQSAERMTLLIRDLLDFSRLLKSETLMQPVNLSEVVNAVREDFELIISEKHAVIEVDELPVVGAVRLQMNQLFYNLISNALKFTRQETNPHIVITTETLADSQIKEYFHKPSAGALYYHIAVKDNGIGFDGKYSEQIFEVFKRLHGRENFAGSGIGLALCRRIVANHNGILFAESSPGKGSTFHIILPDNRSSSDPNVQGLQD